MKRSGLSRITSRLLPARARMAWCMVGTAVYQVGWHSFIQPKKRSALKPGVQKIDCRRPSVPAAPAISPWMWNIGITCSPRSAAVRRSVALMLRADAHTLRCVSGTILGRDVVPDVCRISAMSSACACRRAAAGVCGSRWQRTASKSPAPRSGWACSSSTASRALQPPRAAVFRCPAPRSAPARSGRSGRTRIRRPGRPCSAARRCRRCQRRQTQQPSPGSWAAPGRLGLRDRCPTALKRLSGPCYQRVELLRSSVAWRIGAVIATASRRLGARSFRSGW